MQYTVVQKSQLAKLMATENLTVEHKKIVTAQFDPIGRTLYLPIWKDMSGELYDLLTGHEVGHALYTPGQGWHNVATDKSKGKYFKNFLNVVEDARIEKKVQRRYPGLRGSFAKAYSELMQQDFFGLKGRDANELMFIDRLNLFTKSQYTATWINFNDIERSFLDKVSLLETWEDVLRLTEEIYEYSKSEQSAIPETVMEEMQFGSDGDGDDDGDGDYEDVEAEQEEKQPETTGQSSKPKDEPETGEEKDSDKEEPKEGSGKTESKVDDEKLIDAPKPETYSINRDKKSSESFAEDFEPRCQTDETYRDNEGVLIDPKSMPYIYVTLPKPDLKKIVTPYKRVQQILTEYYTGEKCSHVTEQKKNSWVDEFKKKNERYVGLLAKEFEMRKAARSFSKSKISDTGDIDINKLSSYHFDDNIFRKVMLTPKGKSHGLVLLLDKSGSMESNMAGSIEQILVLTMFCRKVNIPFQVYGFGNTDESVMEDHLISTREYASSGLQDCFSHNIGEMNFSPVRLREYLSSKMSNAEYSTAMRNLVCLKKSYDGSRGYRLIGRPKSESLGNTPLTQAIVATADIMKTFKKSNNLDMTSLVIVHDGDADRCEDYVMSDEMSRGYFNLGYHKVILTDRRIGFQTNVSEYSFNGSVMQWFQQYTNSKVFGFFLTSGRASDNRSAISTQYCEDGVPIWAQSRKTGVDMVAFTNKLAALRNKLRDDKFLVSQNQGYDSFFIIVGGDDLKTEEDILDVEVGATPAKLRNAFMKMSKKKVLSRVLVSRFIEGIAT